MERQKQRRLRFTHEDDVIFLREVVQQIPMLHPERWEIVQINMERLTSKKFVIKTLKQHLQWLIEMWKAKEQKERVK